MVVARIVGFNPAEPEGAARTPIEVGEATAPVGYQSGGAAIAINGSGGGGSDWRCPIKIAAGANPAGHRRKAGSEAVLQQHRLGAAVAAITPLLA